MSEVKASEKEKLLMGAERSRMFGGKDKAGLRKLPGKRASLPAQFYIDYSQPPEQDKQLLKETQKMKAELFAGKKSTRNETDLVKREHPVFGSPKKLSMLDVTNQKSIRHGTSLLDPSNKSL